MCAAQICIVYSGQHHRTYGYYTYSSYNYADVQFWVENIAIITGADGGRWEITWRESDVTGSRDMSLNAASLLAFTACLNRRAHQSDRGERAEQIAFSSHHSSHSSLISFLPCRRSSTAFDHHCFCLPRLQSEC